MAANSSTSAMHAYLLSPAHSCQAIGNFLARIREELKLLGHFVRLSLVAHTYTHGPYRSSHPHLIASPRGRLGPWQASWQQVSGRVGRWPTPVYVF
jgi:hypothetical protein